MTDHSASRKLDAAFAELNDLAFSDESLDDILTRTAELAKIVTRVPIQASVTLIGGEGPLTPAFTGQVALDLDQTQYVLGYGPCLAAAEAGHLVAIEDAAAEERWPSFVEAAVAQGVRSTLSVPLPVQRHVIGALNLYAEQAETFDQPARELAERFGSYAAVSIATTHLYLSAAELSGHMAQAMTSRATIEQAKGVLMGQRRCTADEAFDILVDLSQTSHRKLRDVAAVLIAHVTPG